MKITVIASTYNAEEWLEKVLLGYRCQTWRDFELIVADDGSRESTRALVERFAADYPVPLRHVWHEDEGYRRQEILNVAILEARHDYLLFTDGDCIPRGDFLSTHLRLRRPGRFLSGGYHKLPMQTSLAIGAEDIASGRCFDVAWLKAHGMPASHRNLKLGAGPRLGALLDLLLDRVSRRRAREVVAERESVGGEGVAGEGVADES